MNLIDSNIANYCVKYCYVFMYLLRDAFCEKRVYDEMKINEKYRISY